MFLQTVIEFLRDLWDVIKKVLKSRIFPFVVVSVVLFFLLVYRLFILQIVNGDTYTNKYTLKTQRTVSTTGTRGNIYDRNGVLLAYSELAYSVTIADSGSYKTTEEKNKSMNRVISDTIDIIESHGDTVDFSFRINYDENSGYYYNTSGNTLLRFLRDVYGHSAVSELKENEKNATAAECVADLAERYYLEEADYDPEKLLQIIYIRYNIASNSFKRYVTFTIASDVSKETMASILENASTLTGVTIEEDTIRKYNYSVCMAHIIGYTGKVSETELEELLLEDDSYDANDVVGKAGIEAEFETTLSGTKGYTSMLVDSVGRVQEITESVDPQPGNDVYLTIDAAYQQELYDLLERRLAEILITNIVDSDQTYDSSSGFVTIPVVELYNALIGNGLIDIDKIEASDTAAAVSVYSLFISKKQEIIDALQNELNNGTPYNNLSADMKQYMKKIRSLLLENEILNADLISSTDPASEQWSEGTISLRSYLEQAIHNEWVNIYNLDVSSTYPSYDEVLSAVIEEAMAEIINDDEFDKLVYETLIINKKISGKNICLILMEQGAISYTESEYVSIQNGGSPYDFLMEKIRNLDITPAQLAMDPCSGACVVEDPNTGELLALVTYPSYENNYFSGTVDPEYYASLLADKSSPLVNRATQTKLAIGSTIKPLMALAGLNEGVITATEEIRCTSVFDKITPNIKCHVYPNAHGNQNVVSALQNSCNVYFCEVGYRLSCLTAGKLNHENGLSIINEYAVNLGLGTKTGLQIPETTPHVSDYNAIASSIGQGTNAFSALNLARFCSTLANRGTVYNSTIVDKIATSDGDVVTQYEPVVASYTEYAQKDWDTVHLGMRSVIVNGYFGNITQKLPATIYGKSGTAQEDKTRGDHACFIMFATDENNQPELAVSTMLPYAYAASNAGIMAYYALAAYYDIDIESCIRFQNYRLVIEE